MNLIDLAKNVTVNRNRYRTDSEAVVISCFFNPQNNPYRVIAFQKWYRSIKHLNHRIIECIIGDAQSQLPDTDSISKIHSDSVLWHKESILNKIVSELPKEFRYVFWVDADVLFTNKNWLVNATKKLRTTANIVQPFEYCIHLDKNQVIEDIDEFDIKWCKEGIDNNFDNRPSTVKIWRSFCSNVQYGRASNNNYDKHGHVGFAWGAKREVLERCPLYDRALVGGADHIIAHAAAGHIPHNCITKSFTDDIDNVNEWSQQFYNVVRGKIDYVDGDLYHIWHGDISKRQYLKRIKDFTPESKSINQRDKNGLHTVGKGKDKYVREYFNQREVEFFDDDFFMFDSTDFFEDMGYAFNIPAYEEIVIPSDYYDEVNASEEIPQGIVVEESDLEPMEEVSSTDEECFS